METTRSPDQLGHAEPLRVVDLLQQDAGAALLPPERLHERGDVVLDDVVAEDDHHALPLGVVAGQAERLGDAAVPLLIDVVDVGQAELLAVAQKPQEVARVVAARDEQDVLDAGLHQRSNRIVDHRLVPDREQVLVGDLGQGKLAGAQASRQDDASHVTSGAGDGRAETGALRRIPAHRGRDARADDRTIRRRVTPPRTPRLAVAAGRPVSCGDRLSPRHPN